ncbi:glutaredoxin [Earliella scabrosa]|nr:glutaredoxin [Earliella scabrosa]
MSDAAAPANFHDVQSPEHFQNLLSEDLSRVSLINFWAPWAAPCKQMNEVVLELAKKYPQVLVLQVEAETQADIAESFEVEAVPTFVILRGHTLLGRISGADAPALTKAIAEHARAPSAISPQSHTDRPPAAPSDGGAPPHESQEELNVRLRALMDKERVMLFMKGNPDAPRCGFSRRIVALLRDQGVEFGSFDILTDESVRAGLKVLNNWPTFPQLVVKGEFVGGLDVVTEMVENGELKELLES